MAQVIIYANGETAGSSFHLNSEWTIKADGTYSYGPTVASATYSYSLSGLPAGAKITGITAFARVGARFNAKGGTASGYPQANGVTFTKVSDSDDAFLYAAAITFEDASVTTKVTYKFKSGGYGTTEGSHSGSLSFDDVHLVVDYTPPCSDWA